MNKLVEERRIIGDRNITTIKPRGIILSSVITSLILVGCGSTLEVSSTWDNGNVSIDGVASEWGSHLTPLKGEPVSLGFENDNDFMYVCLLTSDVQVRRQILGLGLTVWFESDAGKLGVRYPLGIAEGGPVPNEPQEGIGEREPTLDQSSGEMELLGPGDKDRSRFSTLDVPGIVAKLGSSQGMFVYEMRIPLERSNDHPYAVGVGAGSTVKLEIETGKVNTTMRRRGEGMRGEGERKPPGGGMLGGGRPGRAAMRNRPEPLDVSINVHLARQVVGHDR